MWTSRSTRPHRPSLRAGTYSLAKGEGKAICTLHPPPKAAAKSKNLLGLKMHSVDIVLPEFQHPELGETFGYGTSPTQLRRVEPEHVLSWRSRDGNWIWTVVLLEHDGQTRLMSRNRFRLPTRLARIGVIPMEPGSLVMERQILLGITRRAEQLTATSPEPAFPRRLAWEMADKARPDPK